MLWLWYSSICIPLVYESTTGCHGTGRRSAVTCSIQSAPLSTTQQWYWRLWFHSSMRQQCRPFLCKGFGSKLRRHVIYLAWQNTTYQCVLLYTYTHPLKYSGWHTKDCRSRQEVLSDGGWGPGRKNCEGCSASPGAQLQTGRQSHCITVLVHYLCKRFSFKNSQLGVGSLVEFRWMVHYMETWNICSAALSSGWQANGATPTKGQRTEWIQGEAQHSHPRRKGLSKGSLRR